jgi:hypothetical protein
MSTQVPVGIEFDSAQMMSLAQRSPIDTHTKPRLETQGRQVKCVFTRIKT